MQNSVRQARMPTSAATEEEEAGEGRKIQDGRRREVRL